LDASQLERVYHEEATRIRAALAARLGDVGLAEDAVQVFRQVKRGRFGCVPLHRDEGKGQL